MVTELPRLVGQVVGYGLKWRFRGAYSSAWIATERWLVVIVIMDDITKNRLQDDAYVVGFPQKDNL